MLLGVILVAFAVFCVRAEDDTAGPVFLKEPPNRVDFSNTTGAVVECSASGNPPADIIWVRAPEKSEEEEKEDNLEDD